MTLTHTIKQFAFKHAAPAALVAMAMAPSLLLSAEVSSVPREQGALHEEFRTLLKDTISQFRSGVGRIELRGESDGNKACVANFYTNGETTFVTLQAREGDFYNEFYIDHPQQSFQSILFQNVIRDGGATALKVIRKDGGYTISLNGKKLVLTNKVKSRTSPECHFSLAKAVLHEGETE